MTGFAISLLTTLRAQVYSDVLYSYTSCPPGTVCTGQVLNPQNVVDSNQTNYATIQNGLGVASSVSLEFGFSTPAPGGSMVAITVQEGQQVLSAGLLSNVSVQLLTSSGGIVVQKNGLEVQDLGLLSGITSAYAITFFTPQGNYNIQRVRITVGGTLNVLNDLRVYNAFYLSSSTNGSGHVCGLQYATNVVAYGCSGVSVCAVATPQLAVDTLNRDDYASLNFLLAVAGGAYIDLSWPTPGVAGQYVGFIVGSNNPVLSLGVLSNTKITLHNAAGAVVYTRNGFSTVGLSLLSGSSDKSILGFYAPVNFASARLEIASTVGLTTTLRVYGAVKFNATPNVVQITTTPFTHLCSGDSVTLTASPGYTQYFWSNGQTGPSITVNQSGTYTLTALDANSCLYYSSVQPIQINPLPVVPVIANINANPTVLCNGASATLTTASPLPRTWSTGETTPSIMVSNAGMYSVTVTDNNGCSSTSDTLTILTDTATVSIVSMDSVTCKNALITLIATGNGPVTWSDGTAGDTLMAHPAVNTIYTASVVSPLGCTDSASVAVSVNPLPPQPVIAGLPSDSITLCNGAVQTLTANIPPGNYTTGWNTGATGNSIIVSASGNYYVQIVDSNGCVRASDTLTVTADTAQISIHTATGGNSTCYNATVPVTLVATANGDILWSNGDTTATIQVIPIQSDTYFATVTTPVGCTNTATFTLTVNPPPAVPTIEGIEPGSDSLVVCNGATATLTVNTLLPPVWSTGATTASIAVSQAGHYYVTVTDPNGCSSVSDTLTVAAETAQINLVSADSATCAGNPIVILVTANGPVTWDDGSTGTAYYDNPNTTKEYTATVTTPLYCQAHLTVTVTVSDTVAYATGEDDELEIPLNSAASSLDMGANDQATGSVGWTILDGPYHGTATISGSMISYVPNPNFSGKDTIVYVICGTNGCGTGCDTSLVKITVKPDSNPSGPEIKIPQGLSPNGDGHNDSWVIDGLDKYPNNKLTVLNRWGDILFKASPYNNDWKGEANNGLVQNNTPIPDGTYYYVLILDETIKPMRGFIEVRK